MMEKNIEILCQIQHDIIKLRDDARTSVSSKHVFQQFPEK